MPQNIPAQQPTPPVPTPSEDRPIIIPPEPSKQIEIDDPPPSKPAFPIREPGVQSPPQSVNLYE